MTSAKCYMSGFSEATDWRPVELVDLQSVWSCSLCQVVSKEALLLGCAHSLCSQCYQTVLQSDRQCPLDNEAFEEGEVQRVTLRPSHARKLKMRCPNSAHGCQYIGTIDEMKAHFLNSCSFHAVTCSRCSSVVLRRLIVQHYREQQCQAGSPLVVNGTRVSTNSDIVNVSLETAMQQLCSIETQLNDHVAGIDGVKQDISALTELHRESSTVIVRQIAELKESLESRRRAYGGDVSVNAVTPADIDDTSRREQNVDDAGDSQASRADRVSRVENASNGLESRCNQPCTMDRALAELLSVYRFENSIICFRFENYTDFRKDQRPWISVPFMFCGYSARLEADIKWVTASRVHFVALRAFLCISRSLTGSSLEGMLVRPLALVLVHPTDPGKNIQKKADILVEEPDPHNLPCVAARRYSTPYLCAIYDAEKEGFVCNNSFTIGVRLLKSDDR